MYQVPPAKETVREALTHLSVVSCDNFVKDKKEKVNQPANEEEGHLVKIM